MVTFAPYGKPLAGSNTSTWASSAQVTVPETRLSFTRAENAPLVRALSMASVNRTERIALRSTLPLLLVGRNRTTIGAPTLRTFTVGAPANAMPSSSTRPLSVMRYAVSGASDAYGLKVKVPGVSVSTTSPWTAGSVRSAAFTAASETGRSSRIVKALSSRMRLATSRVGTMSPSPAREVSITARTGESRAPPSTLLADGPISTR